MTGRHLLFFEPRTEGHHLMFLQHVVEGLLESNRQITLAIDLRTDNAKAILSEKNPSLLSETRQINAYSKSRLFREGSELAALATCFEESEADSTFVNSLDGFASSLLRRAAIGLRPPNILRGRLGGIYERPRWYSTKFNSLNQIIKSIGFNRLSKGNWFDQICLLNEFFAEDMSRDFPNTSFQFLPTPGPRITIPKKEARTHLGVPEDALVLLNYGVGHRRKGLHLVTAALESIRSSKLYLLCAGKQNHDPNTLQATLRLEEEGHAKVINRYITEAEESLCFRASDYVLAPYLSHFGNSNILAQAVLAGRPVIASDFDLIGQRVRTKKLGILFKDQSLSDLITKLRQIDAAPHAAKDSYNSAIEKYAEELSIESFQIALHTAYPKLN